jgi:hypothetical protein
MRPPGVFKGRPYVGRNAAIKRFDAHPSGQPQDLFAAHDGKTPIILELLGTPWIRRGSDLPSGAGTGKRAEVPVEVDWNAEAARPASFSYKDKRHAVDTVVAQWSIDSGWWDRSKAVSRRCFRVLARGGVWDLAYDRLRKEWLLVGIVD